jgi:hypothetical protein
MNADKLGSTQRYDPDQVNQVSRLASATKSTAPRKVVGVLDAVGYAVDGPNSRSGSSGSFPPPSRPSEPDTPKAVGTQAQSVDTKLKDTRKTDRHKPGYQARKQKEYRDRKRLGK